MPFPTTVVFDSCTRANENPINGWTSNPDGAASGVFKIVSNRMVADTVTAWMYYTPTYGNDNEIFCTLSALPAAGKYLDFEVRVGTVGSAGIDYYGCYVADGIAHMYRFVNDVASSDLLQVTVPAWTAGIGLGLQCVGSSITLWHQTSASAQWTQVGGITDTTITTGTRIGLATDSTATQLSNVGGGSFSAAGIPGSEAPIRRVRRT